VIHDRDRIYSKEFDPEVESLAVRVLRTPARPPKANGYCERLVRTVRRECLDFLIPLSEAPPNARCEWVAHYNHGRPHSGLEPGIPAPLRAAPPVSADRHEIPRDGRVLAKPILGGLHHEYMLSKVAA
jgi:transposase InsO family protein